MKEAQIIQVDIRQGDIEHSMPLAEFRDALIEEIGSVTLTVTKKQFRNKVAVGVDRVIQRIRDNG